MQRTKYNLEIGKDIPRYTLAYLENLPTICEGQTDDLKVESDRVRIWLSRCGVEDGEPFNNAVTVECLIDGQWADIARYEAE